jgi:hypothetical protein
MSAYHIIIANKIQASWPKKTKNETKNKLTLSVSWITIAKLVLILASGDVREK